MADIEITEEIKRVAAAAAMKSNGCGIMKDGEHTFCGDYEFGDCQCFKDAVAAIEAAASLIAKAAKAEMQKQCMGIAADWEETFEKSNRSKEAHAAGLIYVGIRAMEV